jgi:hypothetical protein
MQRYLGPLAYGLSGLLLICASTILAFVVIELGYRLHSHRPVLALDDWRIGGIVYRTFGDRGTFDPVLGWVPREEYESDTYNTLDHGIRRNFCERGIRTGGILAVGDAFTAGGMEVPDGETWPAHLERIMGVPVLNAGVDGYAADQSVIRAEQLLPLVEPKTLVVGLVGEAIARVGLSAYGTTKPYHTLKEGRLAYHAPSRLVVASEKDPPDWLTGARHVLGRSAVLDVVLSRLAPDYWYGRAGAEVVQKVDNDPVGVTCALFERLKKRADTGRVRMLLLMQHARQTVAGNAEPGADARMVLACAGALAIEVVDQFKGLRAVALSNPGALDDIYLQNSGYGQMSSEGNRDAAELVALALGK